MVGQLEEPLVLFTQEQQVPIRLEHVVVVENLNAQLLIGEPGKASNKIHTIPHEKMIIIRYNDQDYRIPYISSRGPRSHVARVSSRVTVKPGESLFWEVPRQYSDFTVLQVNPRPQDQHWFSPRDYQVRNNTIKFKNILDTPVTLRRDQVFGEIRMVDLVDCDNLDMAMAIDTGQEEDSSGDQDDEEMEKWTFPGCSGGWTIRSSLMQRWPESSQVILIKTNTSTKRRSQFLRKTILI